MKDEDRPVTDVAVRDAEAILGAPIFIVGAPRSGTTWLQRMLLEHPRVCGGQESHFFEHFGTIFRSFEAPGGDRGRQVGMACYWSEEVLKARVRDFWYQTFLPIVERRPEATLLLEKSPSHARHIAAIHRVLPQARFIHLVRDSRSVVASLLAARRDSWGRWAPKTTRDAAINWWNHASAARRAAATLPIAMLQVHYEDLRRDPAPQLARVFDFLGLDCPDEQLRRIIDAQDFERQRQAGGSAFVMTGERRPAARAEPQGFFRRGEVDSWRRELGLRQQLIVWRYTRKLMWELGYNWSGRIPATG